MTRNACTIPLGKARIADLCALQLGNFQTLFLYADSTLATLAAHLPHRLG